MVEGYGSITLKLYQSYLILPEILINMEEFDKIVESHGFLENPDGLTDWRRP